MATNSFRDTVNSLGWSRRDPDLSTRTNSSNTPFLSRLQSWNPFGQGEGYLQLPTHEAPGAPLPAASRREEEDTFFAFLMGPWVYAKHLVSGPRLPFTAAYFGSIAMTLYFAIGLHSTLLTLISSVFQLAALLWYLVSYFPMGSTGLQFMGRFGAQRVTSWMTS
ncbi:Protein kinase domain family protein [Aspergillus niger]|uniref:Protein transport protein SFT2 n=1 Tax=Aspergillus niger TaxID=5061 RepID=A0A505HQE1_ASPNG|nr:Protein kinase domain family protein [Aspergillus niger]